MDIEVWKWAGSIDFRFFSGPWRPFRRAAVWIINFNSSDEGRNFGIGDVEEEQSQFTGITTEGSQVVFMRSLLSAFLLSA